VNSDQIYVNKKSSLYFKLNLKYLTNFTPNFQNNYLLKKFKKKIFCKNFFLLLLIFEYYWKKSKNLKIRVSYLPLNSKKFTFLRAPNRSKSSQITLKLQRYSIKITFEILNFKVDEDVSLNPKFIVFFFKKIYQNIRFFESNLLINNQINLRYKYNYNLK